MQDKSLEFMLGTVTAELRSLRETIGEFIGKHDNHEARLAIVEKKIYAVGFVAVLIGFAAPFIWDLFK